MTEFNPTSRLTRRTRPIAAVAATLCSVLVLASVLGIALHYEYGAPIRSASSGTSARA